MGNVGILVFGITEMTHPNNASLVGPLFSFSGKRAGRKVSSFCRGEVLSPFVRNDNWFYMAVQKCRITLKLKLRPML
jgi:hypothetical protein